jgi:N-acetylglutamate synthase-like GNAT family acetyltransferase
LAAAYSDIYRPGTELLIVVDAGESDCVQQQLLVEQLQSLRRQGFILMIANNEQTALEIARQRASIYEAFFLTPMGAIVDRDGRRVSLLDEHELQSMDELGEGHPTIPVAGGIGLQAKVLREMVSHIRKAAVTRTDGLQKEMRTSEGSGTLCYHSSALGCSRISSAEAELFRQVHEQNVESGSFRKRDGQELEKLVQNAYAVRVKKAAIGFFSLRPHDDGWVELSAVSALLKNGAGKRVMESATEQARAMGGAPLFALSNEGLIGFFTKHGMTHRGRVSELRHADDVPRFVREYSVPERNPQVFTLTLSQSTP